MIESNFRLYNKNALNVDSFVVLFQNCVMGKRPKTAKKGTEGCAEDNQKLHELVKYQYKYLCERYATLPNPQIMSKIDQAISKNTKIQQIIVNSCIMRPNDIVALQVTFRFYPFLKSLCLWKSALSDTSARLLLQFVTKNAAITQLELIDCGLSHK